MTLKLYLGAASEITARLAGAPSSTTTTVTVVTSSTVFEVASSTGFSVNDPIVVHRQKRIISNVTGVVITVSEAFDTLPEVGDTVAHFNADYTNYRAGDEPLTFTDDLTTGGSTGGPISQDVVIADKDTTMAIPSVGWRISIFESEDPTEPLFAGVITRITETAVAKSNAGVLVKSFILEAKGYQWEADGIGIEEEPFVNINAGEFISYLTGKYTTLTVGDIDTTNSPTVDYIRISNYRRFSDVCRDLSSLWPGSEFFIKNNHINGAVYFRQRVTSYAPITLNESYIEHKGIANVEIAYDQEKTFNKVRLPFYLLQRREPDLFVQSTVADNAFLKTSVTLNGQPTNIEESVLLFDDFADGDLDSDFTEDDLTNASPPTGFNSSDGYLVEGDINGVNGLHLLNTSGHGSTIRLGDIGRVTDPGETQPFTGDERQLLFVKELVVNTLGDAVIGGIIDQSTITTTTVSGSTDTILKVASNASFSANDRVTVGSEKAYISSTSGSDTITLTGALAGGAPAAGVTITKHRLALSRVKFGILFKSTGDLKYLKNGVETAFSTPRTYTASPTTYSLRIFMQAFETTIASGISSTGCTVSDATNFTTGDVVEIFTQGSRKAPEKRVITKSGSALTYAATDFTPVAGYRIRTLPKIVVQIKGGAYGDITGRSWTTIHTEANTWQTSATVTPDEHGIVLCLHKSLVGTVSLFWMKNPPGITGNIGSRYLHIGTQEIDSSELDVDCIIRKVGNHYQLDFFPDTKTLWASTNTLELRYSEKFRNDLEESDLDSMRMVAKQRGNALTGTENEEQLTRLGGRTLDTIDILPSPLTLTEASSQIRAVLDSVKDLPVTVAIQTNTYFDSIFHAGQIIQSTLPGITEVEVKQVQLTEVKGVKNASNRSVFLQTVVAGTVERLSDVLLKRQIKNGTRLVLDDGVLDDSFTKLQKMNISESAIAGDDFTLYTCESPTTIIYDGADYTLLRCILIPVTGGGGGGGTAGTPIGLLLSLTKAS